MYTVVSNHEIFVSLKYKIQSLGLNVDAYTFTLMCFPITMTNSISHVSMVLQGSRH